MTEGNGAGGVTAAGHGGWLAIGLLATATVMFAASNNLVRLSFDHDVNRLTAVAVRSWVVVLALGGLCLIRRKPLFPGRLGAGAWALLVGLGLLLSIQQITLIASFKAMPISLAILIFFVFPILVGLIGWIVREERLTWVKIGAALMAFVGLMVALDVFNIRVGWIGVALALTAALTVALNIVGSRQAMNRIHPLTVTFVMFLISALPLTAGLAIDLEGGVALPPAADLEGWLVFAGAMLLGPFAFVCFYMALPMTTGMRAAMMMNGEPVATMFVAALLLGEILYPSQYLGAALVIAAIYTVTRYGHRGELFPAR